MEFFNFSTKKHKEYFHKPSAFLINIENQEFDYDKNGKIIQRKIFENPKGYTERENKLLENLKKEIIIFNNNNINNNKYKDKIPLLINESENDNNNKVIKISDVLKHFQANNFDMEKTINSLLEFSDFLRNFFPIKITNKTIEILSKTGYLYVHGRDRKNRPILICSAESYIKNINNYTYEEWLNAIIYFSEYIVKYLLIPGQVEQWNIIADISNISLLTLPSDFRKFLQFLQTFYKARLHKAFVYGMSFFMNILWKIIKNFLHNNVENKIIFVDKKNEKNMLKVFEEILPHHLQIKYGGKACDLVFESASSKKDIGNTIIIDSLFPAIFPCYENENKNVKENSNENSNENFIDNLKEEDYKELFTEKEYFELYRNNKIKMKSPYIDFMLLEDKYGKKDF
jgi:hypothetical protein